MPPKADTETLHAINETLAAIKEQLAAATTESRNATLDNTSAITAMMEQMTAHTTAILAAVGIPTDTPPPENTPPPPTNTFKINPPKLTLKTFDGSNPLDWLFQAEQFFNFYNIPPTQRLAMIPFHFSGDALSWFKNQHHNNLITTWEAFTRTLEIRFGPSSFDNHQAALFKLRQTTSVSAYMTEFERLSNLVYGLPHEALLNCFLSGLRTDIQQELAIHRPRSLADALGLAKLIEDKQNAQRFRPKPYSPQRPNPLPLPPILPPPPNTQTATPTTAAPNTTTALPYKRLNPESIQQRRAAGLCFKCPEKWSKGHVCNPPQFFCIADYEDEEGVNPLFEYIEATPPPDNGTATQFLSLSPAAARGVASPRTLRVTGYIAGHPVKILIDSGSTHNIIQPRVTTFLNMPIQPISEFAVLVGNEEHVYCRGFCPNTHLALSSVTFEVPFYVIPIEGAGVVLGCAWLSTLEVITADFSIPNMSFRYNNTDITLTREPMATLTTFHALHAMASKNAIALCHSIVFNHNPTPPQNTTRSH